jgi:hypothetical protein
MYWGILGGNGGCCQKESCENPVAISVSRENAKLILGSSYEQQYAVHHVAAADYHPRYYDDKDNGSGSDNDSDGESSLPFLFDMVISNPPYIPPGEMDTLDATVLNYESRDALCGGNDDDGLQIIRQIIHQLPHWCKPGASCWMEVNPTHPALLQEWLNIKSTSSLSTTLLPPPPATVEFVQTVLDLQGKERFVQLRVI